MPIHIYIRLMHVSYMFMQGLWAFMHTHVCLYPFYCTHTFCVAYTHLMRVYVCISVTYAWFMQVMCFYVCLCMHTHDRYRRLNMFMYVYTCVCVLTHAGTCFWHAYACICMHIFDLCMLCMFCAFILCYTHGLCVFYSCFVYGSTCMCMWYACLCIAHACLQMSNVCSLHALCAPLYMSYVRGVHVLYVPHAYVIHVYAWCIHV